MQQYLGGYKIPLLFMYEFAFYVCLTILSAIFLWSCILPEKNICKYLTDLVQRQLSFPVILPRLLDWQWHWNVSKILQRHNEELFSSQPFSHVPQKMSFWRRTCRERQGGKKKAIYPWVIRARLLKGKGQFGVISLCPQVSFGTWQADCSTLLKQVSLDIEDLETGGGQ